MKFLYLFIAFIFFSLSSCQKYLEDEMIVVKNCTGVYLEDNENDKTYLVCDDTKFEDIVEGTKVKVRYEIKNDEKACESYIKTICELYYPYDEEIYVKSF